MPRQRAIDRVRKLDGLADAEFGAGPAHIGDVTVGWIFARPVGNSDAGCAAGHRRDRGGELGDAGASRAVGLANGSNPIPIIIPCHRVIGADGSLTGFGGGLPTKQALLALESNSRQPSLL